MSPDAGGVERARAFAKRLDANLAIIDKRRVAANEVAEMKIIGEVTGRVAVIIDDIVDTAGTIVAAADAIRAAGAQEVIACCTHAVLSGQAIERLKTSSLEEAGRDRHHPAARRSTRAAEHRRALGRAPHRRSHPSHPQRRIHQLAVRLSERPEEIMEEITLNIEPRDDRGKGAARRLRRTGKVPGVFYGPKSAAMPIAVDRKDFAAHVANLEGSHLIRFESPAAGAATDAWRSCARCSTIRSRAASSTSTSTRSTSPSGCRSPCRCTSSGKRDGRRGGRHPAADPARDRGRVSADRHPAVHRGRRQRARDSRRRAPRRRQMPPNVTAVFESNEAVVTVLPPTVEEVKVAATEEAAAEGAAAPAAAETKDTKESGKGS